MDSRIERHAELIADHCVDIQENDDVYISGPAAANDLVVALHAEIGKRGANPMLSWRNSAASRAYHREMDADDYTLSEHSLAAMDEADALIGIRGDENTAETSDVPPENLSAAQRANQETQEARPDRWVGTQYPTAGNAQKAEMSTEAYAEFVWNAVNKDWDAQHEHQQQLVEILDPAEEVHIRSGDTTDLTMSVTGMRAVNDDARKNLPGGEVFTAPVPDSVEGHVTFDKPVLYMGREIQNAYLEFEGGEVVDYGADQNADALGAILDTDEGARRLGELGIGMNRDIDRFTYNMLFDEKMGDTVHLAVGRAIDECVPEDAEVDGNQSATHVDMIVDMSEDSVIEVDGEVVQRDGTFRFEDGF
ncbi:aminopeptidase [Salarchaeum japonicum]|uniref:aminopeptidase n=1 Tax=Salarchaeum japonicum TaxID=555573 RepID=UPI003C70F96D